MIIDGLDFAILIAGTTTAAGLLSYTAGISKGAQISDAAMHSAAESFVKEHAAELTLGRRMLDMLIRHHTAAICAGEGVTITHVMDWDHAGRTYRFTLEQTGEAA